MPSPRFARRIREKLTHPQSPTEIAVLQADLAIAERRLVRSEADGTCFAGQISGPRGHGGWRILHRSSAAFGK